MDGTLADVRPIRHLLPDFDRFHTASAEVPANPAVVEFVTQARAAGCAIVVMSGRMERFRALSVTWLTRHDIDHDGLFLRGDADLRPDVVVKKELLAEVRQQWLPVMAVDDNPAVLELWLSEGLATVEVTGFDGSVPSREPVSLRGQNPPGMNVG